MKKILPFLDSTAAFFIGIGLGLLAAHVPNCVDNLFGKSPEENLVHFRRLGYEATPLLNAIAAFRTTHGKVPTLDELKSSSLLSVAYKSTCMNGHLGWDYAPDHDQDFRLSLKVGLDESIRYDSKTNTWKYDRGDGSIPTVIDL